MIRIFKNSNSKRDLVMAIIDSEQAVVDMIFVGKKGESLCIVLRINTRIVSVTGMITNARATEGAELI